MKKIIQNIKSNPLYWFSFVINGLLLLRLSITSFIYCKPENKDLLVSPLAFTAVFVSFMILCNLRYCIGIITGLTHQSAENPLKI
jgi:hypothetical protein